MTEKTVPPFQSYTSRSSHNSPKSPGKSLYIVLFLLLVVIIGIGAAQYLSSRSDNSNDNAPTAIEFDEPSDTAPTPTPNLEPTSTATPSASDLERGDLSVVILNGSGVSGAARKLSDTLTELGYEVESTGNADSSDYESTEIEVSSTKKNFLNQLKKDLEGEYTIGDTSTTYTGQGDAQIIIGAE
jgi:hypothetical protein